MLLFTFIERINLYEFDVQKFYNNIYFRKMTGILKNHESKNFEIN